MVPMTLSSLAAVPLPTDARGRTLMCTTVSTCSRRITLAITGLRMSARAKETEPRSPRGGEMSTPITRSTSGAAVSCRANRRPRSRATPVTRTTRPTGGSPSRGLLAEATTLHARLLQQLAVLLLRHALAALLDDRTHGCPFHCNCGAARRAPRKAQGYPQAPHLPNRA